MCLHLLGTARGFRAPREIRAAPMARFGAQYPAMPWSTPSSGRRRPCPRGAERGAWARWRWRWPASSLLALVLRLWGIRWGLPFAYNLDERSHFVPRAVGFFRDGSLDPDYQLNPSGLIEWVAAALLRHPRLDRARSVRAWHERPRRQIWTVARVATRAALHGGDPAALRGREADVRPLGRPGRRRRAGHGVPARPLRPPGAQRRALAGADGAGADRHRRHPARPGGCASTRWPASGWASPSASSTTRRSSSSRCSARRACAGAATARARCRAAGPAWSRARSAARGVRALRPVRAAAPALLPRRSCRSSRPTRSGGLLLGETQRSGYRYYAWSLLWGFGLLPLVLAVARRACG